MGQLFGGRWQWLGRPTFLACVVMLALNDHVLKQRFPCDEIRAGSGSDPGRGQGSDLYAFIGGVLVRTTSGTWERTRVLSVPPVPATSLEQGLSKFMPAFGLVLAAGVWLVGRRRWPSWPMGLAVVAAGWGISVAAGGALGFALEPAFDPMRFIGWLTLGGAVVTSVVAVAVARRPRRPLTPPPHIAYRVPLPTPPHPTPPPPPSATGDHG